MSFVNWLQAAAAFVTRRSPPGHAFSDTKSPELPQVWQGFGHQPLKIAAGADLDPNVVAAIERHFERVGSHFAAVVKRRSPVS